MNTAPRFLFFADSGPQIGGGHVMRCLTLARALMARGGVCAFLDGPDVAAILERFGPGGVEVAVDADVWRPDWLIIDHYRLVRANETALRAPGRSIAVIDDLAERPRDCDLVLDPSYGRAVAEYLPLVPDGATILTGPQYALVRPEFAVARPAALARRGKGRCERILVSLGLTDVGGITGRVVQTLLPLIGDVALDVVVGAAAASLPALRALADPRVTLHIDTLAMADLMSAADLAIGAGGSSTWERACLGLPSITLILADNQRPLARALDGDGVTMAVEAGRLAEELPSTWARLQTDSLRSTLSAESAALCDGLGAGRVAEAMIV